MLSVKNLSVDYNGILAVDDVSIEAPDGLITALIGANGAGKTTLLKTISGLLKPSSGDVIFDGSNIVGMRPDKIVERGISHIPEGRGLFPYLSAQDNLLTGAYLRTDRSAVRDDLDKVYEYFPPLKERRHSLAKDFSGGQQQMLAIGRGIMAAPKFYLFDEPSIGLAPLIVKEVLDTIRQISVRENCGVILVEQNANLALEIANKAYVLELGRVALEGPAEEIANDPEVKTAYLGIA